jgi:hypothetical protein
VESKRSQQRDGKDHQPAARDPTIVIAVSLEVSQNAEELHLLEIQAGQLQ